MINKEKELSKEVSWFFNKLWDRDVEIKFLNGWVNELQLIILELKEKNNKLKGE